MKGTPTVYREIATTFKVASSAVDHDQLSSITSPASGSGGGPDFRVHVIEGYTSGSVYEEQITDLKKAAHLAVFGTEQANNDESQQPFDNPDILFVTALAVDSDDNPIGVLNSWGFKRGGTFHFWD
jgi:hypothetical protein